MFGMPLEQLEKQLGGAQAYEQALAPLREITAMYRENDTGPFLMGNEICFADLIWMATLHGLRIIGEDDVYERLMNMLGEDRKIHDGLLDVAAPWLLKDR